MNFDNKKTKTAGYGLITMALIQSAFKLGNAMGWISLSEDQQAALSDFIFQVSMAFGGLGILGLGHKDERAAAATQLLSDKVEEVKQITETAAGIQTAKDAVQTAVSDAIGNATRR